MWDLDSDITDACVFEAEAEALEAGNMLSVVQRFVELRHIGLVCVVKHFRSSLHLHEKLGALTLDVRLDGNARGPSRVYFSCVLIVMIAIITVLANVLLEAWGFLPPNQQSRCVLSLRFPLAWPVTRLCFIGAVF